MTRKQMWMKETVPHLLTVVLGAVVVWQCVGWLAGVYIIITIIGLVWFLATICTHCAGYGNNGCPSALGRLSAKLFKRPPSREFNRAFRRNIIAVFPEWFMPVAVGGYCLIQGFEMWHLITLIMFTLVAFVYLPLASRRKGCERCAQRNECSWSR